MDDETNSLRSENKRLHMIVCAKEIVGDRVKRKLCLGLG